MGKFVSLGLAAVFLMLVIIALLIPWRGWMHTVNNEKLYAASPLPLYQGVKLTQSILPRYPGLYRIDFLLHNQPVDTGELTLIVKTDCNGEDVLAESTVSESAIPAMSFYPFEFKPLNLPPGQELCLELSTHEVAQENNLAIGVSLGDANPDGEANYATPEPGIVAPANEMSTSAAYRLYLPIIQRSSSVTSYQGFDIGFRLFYTSPPIDTIDALLAHLAAQKPGLFGNRWFYLLLGGIYVFVLGMFLTIVWRSSSSGNHR
jgi:hypothetical protein